jgi:hypothetical protein
MPLNFSTKYKSGGPGLDSRYWKPVGIDTTYYLQISSCPCRRRNIMEGWNPNMRIGKGEPGDTFLITMSYDYDITAPVPNYWELFPFQGRARSPVVMMTNLHREWVWVVTSKSQQRLGSSWGIRLYVNKYVQYGKKSIVFGDGYSFDSGKTCSVHFTNFPHQ